MVKHLTREEVMAIQALNDHSVPKRQIARQLGVDESTVRYHLRRKAENAQDGRKGKAMKAHSVSDVIESWIQAHGEGKRPPNIRDLFEFLQEERGYAGSYNSVLRYCRKKFGSPPMRTYRRVETPPGAQVQIDWGEFPRVKLDDQGETFLSAFIMTLSHSRKSAVTWTENKKMMTWLSCHNRSYKILGGIAPVHRIDNVKTALANGAGPWGKIHPINRSYARAMRFHVDACLPRTPEAKGKVEAKVRLLRRLTRMTTQSFSNLEELQACTDECLEVWAKRTICPATGKTVQESWEQEVSYLQPLPMNLPDPFDLSVTREVKRDCTVSFEGRQYSVPFPLAGRMVEVRGTAQKVQILF